MENYVSPDEHSEKILCNQLIISRCCGLIDLSGGVNSAVMHKIGFPQELNYDDKQSAFFRAIHWRLILLWAKENDLISVIEQADYEKEFTTVLYGRFGKSKQEDIAAAKELYYGTIPENEIISTPGKYGDFPDITADEFNGFEHYKTAALVGIVNTTQDGIDPQGDDLTALSLYCLENNARPELIIFDSSGNAVSSVYDRYEFYCL